MKLFHAVVYSGCILFHVLCHIGGVTNWLKAAEERNEACEVIAWKSGCIFMEEICKSEWICMEDKHANTSAMLFLCLATVLITPASAED